MSASLIANGEYDLPQRNERAAEVIGRYAFWHAGTDAAFGVGGIILGAFVPFGGIASIVASVAAQLPFYHGLAGGLSGVYEAPLDGTTNRILFEQSAVHLFATVGTSCFVTRSHEFLIEQFNTEFLQEIASELCGEYLMGLIASAVPFIGGLAAAGVDIAIAQVMTRRVGHMICAYFQNGHRWPGGTRKGAYAIVSSLPEDTAPKDLRKHIPEVWEHEVEETVRYVQRLLRFAPASPGVIRLQLRDDTFPADVVEEAIRRVFGSPG